MTDTKLLSLLRVTETGSFTKAAESLSLTQPAVSYQLKMLKQARLIKSRREGKTVLYSLADRHVEIIIGMAKEHLEEG